MPRAVLASGHPASHRSRGVRSIIRPAVGLAGLLANVVFPAALLSQSTAVPAAPVVTQIGANQAISGPAQRNRSETAIAIDPDRPLHILAGSNSRLADGTFHEEVYASKDGGKTWAARLLPLAPGEQGHGDPSVVWTPNGTAWAAVIRGGTAGGHFSLPLVVFRSADGGLTWVRDGSPSGGQIADRPTLWVDRGPASPRRGTLYVVWQAGPVLFSRRDTTTGTWSAPVQVSGAESSLSAWGADLKTDARGVLYIAWPDSGSRTIYWVRSPDGGRSFTRPAVLARTFGSFVQGRSILANQVGAPIYVTLAPHRGPAGVASLAAAWVDLAGGPGCQAVTDYPGQQADSACTTRVWFADSRDRGTTWSAPRKLNNAASKNDQFHQALVADPADGSLGLVYYDTVLDPERRRADVWFQRSVDGVTWTPAVRVTTASSNESWNTPGALVGYGDYLGMAADPGLFLPAWTDRRLGGREQVWIAPLRATPAAH